MLACSGEATGVCIGQGGFNGCQDGWTRSECEEWSQMLVDGTAWNFTAGETCRERGYPLMCPDGRFVDTGGVCP